MNHYQTIIKEIEREIESLPDPDSIYDWRVQRDMLDRRDGLLVELRYYQHLADVS